MNLPVLVNPRLFFWRRGPNSRVFSAAQVIARAAASSPRTVRSLRQSTSVSRHDARSAIATALKELLRKQPLAPSIDWALAEEKPGCLLGHAAAERKRAARTEQGEGRRDVGRVS